jgi:flagellar protein FliO/FliZ
MKRFNIWAGWCCLLANKSVLAAAIAEPVSSISHGEMVRVVIGLIAVLLVIACLSWLLKRMNVAGYSGSAKGFQTIASMMLGPKERISLMKVGTRYLLLGMSAHHINFLYDFGEELPQGFEPDGKAGFSEVLKSALRKSK